METPVLSWKKKLRDCVQGGLNYFTCSSFVGGKPSKLQLPSIFQIYVLSNPEFPVLKEIQRFEWSEFQSKTISKRMFGKISSFESSYETHPRSQFSQENKRSHAIWRMLNFHFHISIMAAR